MTDRWTYFYRLHLKKATVLIVAFFVFLSAKIHSAENKFSNKIKFSQLDEIKKKATSLLLLNQRWVAYKATLDIKEEYLSDAQLNDLQQFRYNILTQFFTLEGQDLFETAATLYRKDLKNSVKLIQKCLKIEFDHFWCQWADLRLQKKSNRVINQTWPDYNSLIKSVPQLKPYILSFVKDSEDFKNLNLDLIKKIDTVKKNDSNFINDKEPMNYLKLILEFDRSILAQNYLLAKESLVKLKSQHKDYHDLVAMDVILEKESNMLEEAIYKKNLDKLKYQMSIYKKQCQSIPPEISRKYFFDVDYCDRSLSE